MNGGTISSDPTQRVGFLSAVPGMLRDFGVDPTSVLASAGLSANALDDPEARIPFASMGLLIEAATRATKCEHFGLLVGQKIGAASLGLIGELMSHAPTLRVALRDVAIHQHHNSRGAVAYLLECDDQALFGYAIYHPGTRAQFQIYDGAAAAGFNIIRQMIPAESLHETEVLLSRAAPEDPEPYRRFFIAKLHFDADQTGVLLPRSWLDQPIPDADAARRKQLEQRVAAYRPAGDLDIVSQVRRTLRVGLLTGEFSGDQVAERLRIPRRTLQRRLLSLGTAFQNVLDETRFEFAQYLLAYTGLAASDISMIVRYADPSVFTRAFARWTGKPPNEWRLTHRSIADPLPT